MNKVFSTSIVVFLTVLGIATSCKNQQDPQPENQAVVNVKPLNSLVESESTSNPNARTAALSTQQMFRYSSQVVGSGLRKIYSIDANKLFNSRQNLVRSYTSSGQVDLTVCYLNSKGLYVPIGTKSTNGFTQEVRFHKSEIVGSIVYILVNGVKANSNFDVAFYMLSATFPETTMKKKTDTSPYSSFFTIPGECVWYEYVRINELVDLGYISKAAADNITAKLKGKTNRHAKTWPGFIGGTWIETSANNPLPNKYRRKGLIGVYKSGVSGHIFTVESVSEDLKTYTISEYNWPSGQKYGTRILTFGKDQGLDVYPTFYELELTN